MLVKPLTPKALSALREVAETPGGTRIPEAERAELLERGFVVVPAVISFSSKDAAMWAASPRVRLTDAGKVAWEWFEGRAR